MGRRLRPVGARGWYKSSSRSTLQLDQSVIDSTPPLGRAMSCRTNGIPIPPYTQDASSKPASEECKRLLSNFDVGDRDNDEPPCYKGGECPEPRERSSLRMGRIGWLVGVFIALTLGASFHAQMPRSWCGGMGITHLPMDPSKLLSNGTHDFKRTVLIVSIDGLR